MKFNPAWLRRIGLVLLVLALLAAMAFVLTRTGPLAPTRITVTEVAAGRLQPSIFGIGTVEAQRSALIGPTVPGRVLSVAVDVGDMVQAGQVLAEMDPVDLDQRLAALNASIARAASGEAGAQAQLADATARQRLAEINAQRNQTLADQNFISAGALEARQQEKLSADAGVLSAQANLRGQGQERQRLMAERQALAQQRSNVRLVASTPGVVVSREAEPGSTVVAGQAVLRLVDPASLWVKLRVDQGRSAGLASGLSAQIILRSRPAEPVPGRVARVELVADSVTEERVAQVAFDSLPPGVAMGELAEVTLALPQTPETLVLPNAAIQHWQGETGVWRLREGSPEFAPVRLGARSLDGLVQALDGLAAGDTVVVYSAKALTPGARVSVVEALVKASTSGAAP
jgi:HlyD family secretion protein